MYYFSILILIVDYLAIVYGLLGSTEYCAELKSQANLTIHELTGRWYGAEIITHRESIYGDNNVIGECIQLYITEINEEMVTKRPRQFDFDPMRPTQPLTTRQPSTFEQPRPNYEQPRPNYEQPPSYAPPRSDYEPSRPNYEQPRPSYEPPRPNYDQPRPSYETPQRENDQNLNDFYERNYPLNESSTMFPFPALSQIAVNNSMPIGFDHLRLEWTESETKWEYIAKYNRAQNGLWIASAPQQYRSSALPNYSVSAGTIEVILVHRNYLVLKFCEIIPRQQLFTIILGREPNSIPLFVIKEIRNKLMGFNLPTVYRRHVCNGVGTAIVSHNLIIIFVVASITSLKSIW